MKEMIAENYPNLGKDMDIEVHRANTTPHFLNAYRPSPIHIIIKLSNLNE